MSNVPRSRTINGGRQQADTTRWPVLARLLEASADSLSQRVAKQVGPNGIEYRFDPPQPRDSVARAIGSTQPATSPPPHMFDRGRKTGHRRIPRRESSVLPRSNPFSNPRPRLIDSVAPAIRFLTMVILFTAAGIWIQMIGRHQSPTRSIESPKTAAHPTVAPAKNAGDHTVPGPTATGPLKTQPESGARVGRIEGNEFASQENTAAGPVLSTQPTVAPPHYLISSGSHVPRVRVADSAPTTTADGAGQGDTASPNSDLNSESADGAESDGSPVMARYPGFSMETPTR